MIRSYLPDEVHTCHSRNMLPLLGATKDPMDVLLVTLASVKPVGSGTSLVSKNDFVINSSVISSVTGYVRYLPMAFMVREQVE